MPEEHALTELVPRDVIVDQDGIPLQVQAFDQEGPGRTLMIGRAMITLSTRKGGGLTRIRDSVEIDSNGYRSLNQVAGLHILNPPTVFVDGEVKGNPYYHRHFDKKTQERVHIDRVVISKAVAGLSPLGKLVTVHKTLEFDVATYLNEAALKMIRDKPATGCMGLKSDPPRHLGSFSDRKTEGDEVPKNKQLGWLPIHGHDIGIWLDLQHSEVINMWSDYTTLLKFVSRRAETTILRLCFQDHPAIGKKKVSIDENGLAKIPVFFHRDGLLPSQVQQLQASLGVGGDAPTPPKNAQIFSEEITGTEATAAIEGELDDAEQESLESGEELFHQEPQE